MVGGAKVAGGAICLDHTRVTPGLLKGCAVVPGALLDGHEARWQAQAAAAAPSGVWVPQNTQAASAAAHAPQGLAQSGPGRPASHPYGAALAAGAQGYGHHVAAPNLAVTSAPAFSGGFPGATHPATAPGVPGSAPLSSLGALQPPLWPAQGVPPLEQGLPAASVVQHGAAAQPAAAFGAGPGAWGQPHAAPGGDLQQAQPAGAAPGSSQAAAPGGSQTCGQLL